MVLEHKPFNVIDVIDEVLVVGRLRAPEFGVTIKSIGTEDLVHTDVIGSPDHVRRVLLNLVDNAVKYNRLGGTVRCAVDELGVKGNIVTYRFVVSDTGVGMSEESRSTIKKKKESTGLGIAVRNINDRMKGYYGPESHMHVESEEGVGTTITLLLKHGCTPREHEDGE